MEDYNASEQIDAGAEWEEWKLSFDMEVDKVPGFWVVTGWFDEDVVLRLRIAHPNLDDVFEVFCEVHVGDQDNFELVGKTMSSLWELADESPTRLFDEKGGPQAWREEFRAMARSWSVSYCILVVLGLMKRMNDKAIGQLQDGATEPSI